MRSRGTLAWAGRAGQLLILLCCAAPLVAALLPLMLTPRDTLADAMALGSSERLWILWGRTCAIAAATAVLGTVLGTPLGIALSKGHARGHWWLAALLTAPLFIPPHVLSVAWIDILGQQGLVNALLTRIHLPRHELPLYTPSGVVLVQSLSLYPLAFWAAWLGQRQVDPLLLEAARNLGAGRRHCLRIWLPLLAPAVLGGFLIIFLFSLLSFSVPSLLQVPVFTVEIYTSFNSLLDQRRALLMALPLALSGLLVLTAAVYFFRRSYRWNRLPGERGGNASGGCSPLLGSAMILVATVLPMGALAARSLPASVFLTTATTSAEEIGTSALLAATSATLALALAILATWGPGRPAQWTLWIASLAYLVSGPVFGVGLIQLWNRPGFPGYLYDHFPILMLAATGRYLIVALLGCWLAHQWTDRDAVAAARVMGARPWRVLGLVVLSPLRRPLFALWSCLALLVLGEVECIVLVSPPGWVPVSLRIYTLMHYGPAAMVSALALLQAAAALALVMLVRILATPAIYTLFKSRYHRAGSTRP